MRFSGKIVLVISNSLLGVHSFDIPFLPITSCGTIRQSNTHIRHVPIGTVRENRPLYMALLDPDTKPKKQKRSMIVSEESDEGKPLEPVGTQFFGGSMEKETLFDETIEEKATTIALTSTKGENASPIYFSRFKDELAFPTESAIWIGMQLQAEINAVLYEDVDQPPTVSTTSLYSSPSFVWESPFSSGRKDSHGVPIKALQSTLDYYRHVDAAILSVNFTAQNICQVRWTLSVVWPNAWESRVVLTGTSTLNLSNDGKNILKQSDRIDNGGEKGTDLVNALSGQLSPRFWDVYHFGMTPSAEQMQRLPPATNKSKGFLSSYQLFDIAPRLVFKPTMIDKRGRTARAAQCVPNHGFSCAIKTAGRSKQRFVPTKPLEIRIKAEPSTEGGNSRASRITWVIPVPAEVACSFDLPLPVTTDEDDELEASSTYEFEQARRVATLPFGGFPQDEGVADVRKRLFDAVTRDGWKPKLDDKDRPIFFFLQNNAKCCFTEEGMGMVVYEARPEKLKTNEIGIELIY